MFFTFMSVEVEDTLCIIHTSYQLLQPQIRDIPQSIAAATAMAAAAAAVTKKNGLPNF